MQNPIKVIKQCAVGIILTLPVGCVPAGAEPFTDEQTANAIDDVNQAKDHLDLLQTVVTTGDQQLVEYDNDNPTPDELRAQWETTLNRGLTMLTNNRVYIISDDDANDDLFVDKSFGAYAHNTADNKNEFIVFKQSVYDMSQNVGGLSTPFIAFYAHETDHTSDPDCDRDHNPGIVEDITATDYPTFDETTYYHDVPYQDTRLFRLYSNLMNWCIQPGDHIDNVEGTIDYNQDTPYFTYYYDAGRELLNTIKNDQSAWATLVMQARDTSSFLPPGVEKSERELMGVNYTGTINDAGYDLKINDAGWVDILSSPGATFLWEQHKTNIREMLTELRVDYPEYYEAYRQEKLSEASRSRPAEYKRPLH